MIKIYKTNQQLSQWKYAFWLDSKFYSNNVFSNIFYSNESVENYQSANNILFSVFGYNLKNKYEKLTSTHTDHIKFPDKIFIQPEMAESFSPLEYKKKSNFSPLLLQARTSKAQYIDNVNELKKQIKLGNIYEINYCIEFFATDVSINPLDVFSELYKNTKTPFSCFVKINDSYLLCASPERFLKRDGSRLVSQPIKGTIKRGCNKEEDLHLKKILLNNAKEQSENTMIVDLVRNDFSRIAKRGSVHVDELFGIYTFETVHQMISTVSCAIDENISLDKILHATFPMGSMTGAPKIKAMQLIEEYENMNRGLYSGSVGYMLPNGNFDFNVVIRSIQYNEKSRYLSIMVGSAITDLCNAEDEYNECLLKAKALLGTLNAKIVC